MPQEMAKENHSINLFKKEEKSVIEKFLDWALTIGRILVILTEAVALSAFLYRFTLDMQLVDLHDKIKRNLDILSSMKHDEDTYRDLQERLASSKNYAESADHTKTLLNDLITAGQGYAIYNNLTIAVDTIHIDAGVTSVSALTAFINALRQHPDIKSLSIDKIENKTSEAIINVTITAKLKKALVTIPKAKTAQTEEVEQP